MKDIHHWLQDNEGMRVLDCGIVPFTEVHIDDGFWTHRMETNQKVTIPYAFGKCEETGRIDNFSIAGGLMEGTFCGIYCLNGASKSRFSPFGQLSFSNSTSFIFHLSLY